MAKFSRLACTTRTSDSVPAEVVPPNPANLVESLRDFGYTLPTALADLVDNSITASSQNIRIVIEATASTPHIAVIDDGGGMSEQRLVEAMRLSGRGPNLQREATDLGRFGLGLKTASLSQGQCLTVITKNQSASTIRRWDLSHIRKAGEWQLLASPTSTAMAYADAINTQRNGTAVVIENLDRLSFLKGPASERPAHLSHAIETLRLHLGMVFHRFIAEDRLNIFIGPSRVPPWDPYLHGVSTELPTEQIGGHAGTAAIAVTPFVLPHHSRLTDEQHSAAAGILGWNAHQGFYVYRGRRLIVPGSWLNLNLRKEEHLKLARIRVDLPNTLDSEWHLNVIKSHVAAPSYLRDSLKRIATVTRQRAADVYRVRGERQAPSLEQQHHFVWRRLTTARGVRFKVDRTHPVIRSLLHAGCGHDGLLADVVELLETTLPVASIIQEPEKSLDGLPQDASPTELAHLVAICRHTEQHFVRMGKTPREAREIVLASEPFVRFRLLIEKQLDDLSQ
jgi:hypothetical protein